jgi:hypothetical protein
VTPPTETAQTAAVIAALIADRDRQAPKRPSAPTTAATTTASQDGWLRLARLEGLR